MRVYPQHRLIQADAMAAVLAWFAIPIGFIAILAGGLLFPGKSAGIFFTPWVMFFVFGLAHALLAFLHQCPDCHKHPTIQGFKPVHERAIYEKGIAGWSRVVWNVFRSKPFRCIHCGEEFVARQSE
jgi:hypothetical protein